MSDFLCCLCVVPLSCFFHDFSGSMALMDAGIPLREHVAGVSVGLVSDMNSSTGEITDYRILTDILVRKVLDQL